MPAMDEGEDDRPLLPRYLAHHLEDLLLLGLVLDVAVVVESGAHRGQYRCRHTKAGLDIRRLLADRGPLSRAAGSSRSASRARTGTPTPRTSSSSAFAASAGIGCLAALLQVAAGTKDPVAGAGQDHRPTASLDVVRLEPDNVFQFVPFGVTRSRI